MKKKKILIITKTYSTFVLRDLGILEKKYRVIRFTYKGEKDLFSNILAQLSLKFWLLRHIWTSYALYIWFADYHAFLPVLFSKIWKKKAFVIEGGYDTVIIPEIHYGSHFSGLRSKMSSFAMKHASLNLPVCETLTPEIMRWAPNAKIQHLYTGYDSNFFKAKGQKKKLILTVATGNSEQRIRLKGINEFINVAQKLPDYRFIIIGIGREGRNHLINLPDNCEIFDKMNQKELLTWYQQSKIYAQFSMREGLPNVVCEAMLCECIPVGFRVGGIPVAIGNAGYIIENRSIDGAVNAIKLAMDADSKNGIIARQHIIDRFPQKAREEKLLELLADPNL
jgi:glycosyltransferase involved in cell wall biosynthesis